MSVDVIDRTIVEKATDHRVGLSRLRQRRINHRAVRSEGAEGQDAPVERRRNFVHEAGRTAGILGDEDGVRSSIGIVAVVRYVIDQQHRLTGPRVVKGDPTGKADRRVGDHPRRAVRRELLVGAPLQMGEWRWVEALDSVGHGDLI